MSSNTNQPQPSDTPLVLGHPADASWCEAVDAHHAATEDELREKSERVETLERENAAQAELLNAYREQDGAQVKRIAELEECIAYWKGQWNCQTAECDVLKARLDAAMGQHGDAQA